MTDTKMMCLGFDLIRSQTENALEEIDHEIQSRGLTFVFDSVRYYFGYIDATKDMILGSSKRVQLEERQKIDEVCADAKNRILCYLNKRTYEYKKNMNFDWSIEVNQENRRKKNGR